MFMPYTYLLYRKRKWKAILFFLIFSFLVLYIGYNVRTALLMYIVYIFMLLFLMHDFFKYLWLQIVVLIPVLLLMVLFTIQSIDINKLSSGRIEMYGDKFEILKEYNFLEFAFGKGAGSDFIKTESWWWEEMGSHSDFITYTVENGLIYLMAFITIIFSLLPYILKINLIFFTFILCYFISSIISNGIADRPLAGYVFFLGLATIYLDIVKRKELNILYG